MANDEYREPQQAAREIAKALLVPPALIGAPRALRPYDIDPAVFDSWVRYGYWLPGGSGGE